MWLAVDVGNTNTVLGCYPPSRIDQLHRWRISSDQDRTVDEQILLLDQLLRKESIEPRQIDRVVIGSVVPALTHMYAEALGNLVECEIVQVSCRMKLGIKICTRDPEQIGADRLANAVAARHRYSGAVIVVDFGTATTFDVISSHGEYLGGVIAPGMRTSASDLFIRAAKLPRFVEIREPQVVIGKTTEESILSGLFYGTIGQVDEIVKRIVAQLKETVTVVATGGLAHLIAPGSEAIQEVCPDLTLEGLILIGTKAATADRSTG
jgi:type III pantothenate kinase